MNSSTWKNIGRIIVITSLLGVLLFNTQAATARQSESNAAQTTNKYYVDSVKGSDSNSGKIPDKPWKTLDKVRSQNFAPGSIIHFKRGSVFTGGFTIDDSGTKAKPIKFTVYGNGPNPVFSNPGSFSDLTSAITIRSDWVIVEKLTARNAQLAGVYIQSGADHNVVRYMNITKVGEGVKVNGRYNKILRNNIHDLVMVRNTPGEYDDYGAVGVWLFNGNNVVAYNRITNCRAPSYDYGEDGGTIEFWANDGVSVNNNYIHHNYAQGNKGFSEFGGNGGTIYNNRIAYNVIVDNDRPLGFHLGGGFYTPVKNLRFENNTVVDRRDDGNPNTWKAWTALIFNGGSPTPETLIVRNNIFYLADYDKVTTTSSFTHYNNIYFFKGKDTSLGFPLGNGEKIVNPRFVDVSNGNFHLLANSPAINKGSNLNYNLDYDNKSVPVGPKPDIGAYEYR
ncbi:MAG: choice-of-anchor Q domain-containing protein [Chloroflexota bacterium]